MQEMLEEPNDRQQMLEGLNDRQLLVGWFHSYLKDMDKEYNEFNNELNKRGL